MKVFTTFLALAVSLMIVSNLSAEEKEKGPRPDRPRGEGMQRMFPPMQMFRGLDLSEEQKAKFDELWKEYAPKFKEITEKHRGILTEEQKQARAEAAKAAKEAGKKGKEFRDAVQEALKLTDEQKAKMAELQKEMETLHKEFHEKGMDILTPEQKELLKQRQERRKERKPKGE